MAEVSTIPVYILANEHLLFWMLKSKMTESVLPSISQAKNQLKTFAYVDFHRWNSTRPDHVFRHRWECFERDYLKQDTLNCYGRKINILDERNKYCSVVLAALKCLSDEYLSYRDNQLHVHLNCFGWWQNMLSRVSSLPIQAYARWQLQRERTHEITDKRAHLTLHPYDEGVENYINRHGLNDSHMHVNLCAYAEECWLYALYNTQNEWEMQQKQFDSSSDSEELYREIHIELTPKLMLKHMQIAKRLRYLLTSYAIGADVVDNESRLNEDDKCNYIDPITKLANLACIPPIEWEEHHIKAHRGVPVAESMRDNTPFFNVFDEMDWMQKIIQKQSSDPNLYVERAFHLYILLMNEFMTLCVQRDNCYGFKQFQKYSDLTMSLVASATYYERVFERMHGCRKDSQVNYVELRIAPKNSYADTKERIIRVLGGYLSYVQHHLKPDKKGMPDSNNLETILPLLDSLLENASHGIRLVRPTIVMHLIKLPWKKKKDAARSRYGEQRRRYAEQLADIRKLLTDYKRLRKWIRGIDAAADEMDTPPDTFAAAYRFARKELNLPHATYHAGEDFYHLVSGIRSVCEAIDMLGLRSGDRIGHATALGVDPALWMKTMPGNVTPTRGEWLQDLLFAWNILQDVREKQHLVQRLNRDIREHAYTIFKRPHLSPYILTRLFALRELDSATLLQTYEAAADYAQRELRHSHTNHKTAVSNFDHIIQQHLKAVEPSEYEKQLVHQAFLQETPEVMELLVNWHRNTDTWEESERRIEVPTDYFTLKELTELQQLAMARLVSKGIIVETLPTSNLRIGQYKEIGQHHSLRWLGVEAAAGDSPIQIVLGTDDPGVFATDIKAEFYHLFASLHKRGLNRQEALEKLIRIDEAGNRYAFRTLANNCVE